MADMDRFYIFGPVELEVKDFPSEGFVLDIGGGGAGVIGRLKGPDVVAIDIRKEELEEAAEGPLKIVMDARDLKFLDGSFHVATAFFSLMYVKSREDQQQIFKEAARVLKPGAILHIWEVDLEERPQTDLEFYIVSLCCRVRDLEINTGYGVRWPEEARGEQYYVRLAEEAGFQHLSTERVKHTFHLVFRKG